MLSVLTRYLSILINGVNIENTTVPPFLNTHRQADTHTHQNSHQLSTVLLQMAYHHHKFLALWMAQRTDRRQQADLFPDPMKPILKDNQN